MGDGSREVGDLVKVKHYAHAWYPRFCLKSRGCHHSLRSVGVQTENLILCAWDHAS